VVVVQRTGNNDEEHGKVVNGRGYVSGRKDGGSSGAKPSGDRSSGRASSGSSGSDDKKGESTGRKAKRKP